MFIWFPNSLTARIFISISFLWAATEAVNTLAIGHSRHTAGTLSKDEGSYWVLYLAIWGSIIVSFLARALNLGVFRSGLQYLGLGLMVLGITFREWAILALGRFFSVRVTIHPDHQLIRRGPYRWLRHPAYAGSILTLIGIPFSLGTWVGGLLALVLSLIGFLYRAQIEEKALLEAFGNEYRDYMQHTWRFFPGL